MINCYKCGERGDRPWGRWVVDKVGDNYIQKSIYVNVEGCLSLQSHQHRSEEWKILEGEAEVIIGDNVTKARSGSKFLIPAGTVHRIRNIGSTTLIFKEIQKGDILDENDITRYEDIYGRTKS